MQRKIEQKRDIERKRAAQQEEFRRQEQAQQQEAERQRERERSAAAASDPKKLAQRQAIEKRRLENGKREQQRQASQQEKNQSVPTNRQEVGGPRPPSRLHGFNNNDFGRSANQPPSGAVKPSGKRVFEPDIEEETMGPTHGQGGSLYPQLEAKRRRTDDDEFLEVAVRPTMLPPKRQSNARKVRKRVKPLVVVREGFTAYISSRTVQSNLFSAMDTPHHIHPLIFIINRHLY